MENLGVPGFPPGFDFALDNTEKEQADWIAQGFTILRELGYVRFGIVFNLDYSRKIGQKPVSYTHLRAHETVLDLVCRLLLEKK